VTRETSAGELGHEGDQAGIPIHGLDGAEAQAREAGLAEDVVDERGQGARWRAGRGGQFPSPTAEIDSGEDQLIATGSDKALYLLHDGCEGQAFGIAAGLGNDAEGAAVAAALLNFEVGAGLLAGHELRFFDKGVGEEVVGPDGSGRAGGEERLESDEISWGWDGAAGWDCLKSLVKDDVRSEGFVAVADDGGDAGDCGQFVWGALGIATSDDDAGLGVEAVGTADEGAGGAVSLGGDAAGVDDDDFGFVGVRLVEAGGAQATADGFAIGAGGSASEVFHVEIRHCS